MAKTYSIAIDGPAGAGKSTIAKRLAKELGYYYVDTGAIYRTVAYFLDLWGISPKDVDGVNRYIDELTVGIEYDEDGTQHMIMNGMDVTGEIRTQDISQKASLVSAHAVVRDMLLDMQRNVAKVHNVIMDGRDIGTVVLPKANVKIFLTASAEVRAKRRTEELTAKGEKANYQQILKEIQQRDYQDTHREIAPLKMARDSIKVDTSELDIDQVVAEIKAIAGKKIPVMSVKLAKSAGFCFGVSRAVETVEKLAAEGKRVVTLGPIIHNRHVVEKFQSMGVGVIDSPEDAVAGSTVIIRSHGVSRDVCRRLEAQGVEVVDATCPFVKRIHGIVSTAEDEGRIPIIIGTRAHPEVEGIAGWCSRCLIFESPEELENWIETEKPAGDTPLCMVSQTTSTEFLWKLCGKIAKKQFTNLKIFDTICRATEIRQTEAAQLSKNCDAMVVVGDLKSSNTGRLAMICREHCDIVALVDNASDLKAEDFCGATDVGITAGASTPAWIIKEVNKTMSEIINVEAVQEENFAELLEQSIKTLNTGDKVLGTVTGIGNTEIQVDLGTKHAGYIPYDEVSADPSVKPEDILHVGDEIEVFVVRVNDQEGTVQLSKKKLDGLKIWDDMAAYAEEKATIEAVITEENKGGLVATHKGIRIFVPASQSGVAKGGDMAGQVGKTVQLKVTEVNRARRRVIGSIRAVASEARKANQEKIWAEIENGKKYHGTVKSLTSYGAFVDIGGVDGMVHVSELSWNHIKTPSEVVKVGDEIDVYVISFDPEKRKISLGYKTAEMNPWNQFMTNYQIGDVVDAKVVKLMTFGAFAEILPGVDGLIHISQIADRRIGKPEDVLSEGQDVKVKITDVDAEAKRISLSIRALLEEQAAETEEVAE